MHPPDRKHLERENKELRRADEILRTASATPICAARAWRDDELVGLIECVWSANPRICGADKV